MLRPTGVSAPPLIPQVSLDGTVTDCQQVTDLRRVGSTAMDSAGSRPAPNVLESPIVASLTSACPERPLAVRLRTFCSSPDSPLYRQSAWLYVLVLVPA